MYASTDRDVCEKTDMESRAPKFVAQVLWLGDHFASALAVQTFELYLFGFVLPEI